MSSWPTRDWRRADPTAVGMRPELLADLEREVSARFGRIRAVLINRGGQLVFERYFGGCGQDDAHLVASVTKSVLSALVGIAIDRGFIRGVDQRVLDFFPDYAPGGHERLKRRLTLKHLLTMTAGFQWRTGPRGHELFLDRLRRSRDWVAFILNLPVKEGALGTFQYNSAAAHLLSAIITRSTGRCAREFAATHLFGPLGIDLPADDTPHGQSRAAVFGNRGVSWPTDPHGNSIGGWGLVLRPRDMARFGLLYLNRGRWNGAQIVPTRWVEESVTPHTPGYGYLWWLRDVNGVFVFSAAGRGGQHIFCVPEHELVVVVASEPGERFRDPWPLLEDFVLPAVAR